MARKWSNLNLPGALHYVTGTFLHRIPVFSESACCQAFLEQLQSINQKWPSKLIAYVLMPDHFHLINNPHDGRIKELIGELKSLSAKRIVRASKRFRFPDSGAEGPSGLARKLQGPTAMERLDDLAEDQLHSCKPGEGWTSKFR